MQVIFVKYFYLIILFIIENLNNFLQVLMKVSIFSYRLDLEMAPMPRDVTRGDHVSWPTIENMISTMMMINMSTNGSPTTPPLIHLYSYRSTKAHHIQATQSMGDGKTSSP
jgi:hypothetical protein